VNVTGPPSRSRTTLIAISRMPTDWPPRDHDHGKYMRLNTTNASTEMAMPMTAGPAPSDPTEPSRPTTIAPSTNSRSTNTIAITIQSMMNAASRAPGPANRIPGAGPPGPSVCCRLGGA
jgi:hypothetical protein